MDDINKVILYIESHFTELSISNKSLADKFNLSNSKLTKAFKKHTGTTIRKKIIQLKLDLAGKLKANDTRLTLVDVMTQIGWNFSDRTFIKRFKTHFNRYFRQRPINPFNIDDPNNLEKNFLFIQMKNAVLLNEILFRFVLLTEKYTIKNLSQFHKQYTVRVVKSILQFSFIPMEKEMIFDVYYNQDSNETRLNLYTKRDHDEEYVYVPNCTTPYLNLITNISNHYKKDKRFEIKDAIYNWDSYITPKGTITTDWFGSFSTVGFSERQELFLNYESDFIQLTEVQFNQIREDFCQEINKCLITHFQTNLKTINDYISKASDSNLDQLKEAAQIILAGINLKKIRIKVLDLLLRIAESPYTDQIEYDNYKFEYDSALIDHIVCLVPQNKLPDFICSFKKQVDQYLDFEEYDSNDLLKHIAKMWDNNLIGQFFNQK